MSKTVYANGSFLLFVREHLNGIGTRYVLLCVSETPTMWPCAYPWTTKCPALPSLSPHCQQTLSLADQSASLVKYS
eukprot:6129625-Amphidinium_carterae.1